MRMPRYYVQNDGMGPYAIFYCDRDNREYRSQPKLGETIAKAATEGAKRGLLGGLLRNIPIVGDSVAGSVEQQSYEERYRSDMSAEELATAWSEVEQYFRECPTCHQIVCVPDFDEQSGFCMQDSPRAAQIAEGQAQQAAGVISGIASAFGLTGAVQQAQQAAEQAQAASTCRNCQTVNALGTKFCSNCGQALGVTCGNCQTVNAAGTKFCGNCGTALA
jgi:double zinc ribbon protein